MTSQTTENKEKSIVLVGLMGAGKSSVGRVLAHKLGLPFVDSDDEVEQAAGCSIEDIFEFYGEAAFRDVEARVLKRLLDGPPQVIASGGGAFMNDETRRRITDGAVAVWLRADLATLERRTRRRHGGRPLLKGGSTRAKLKSLIDERYPVYAEADIIIDSMDEPPDKTAGRVLDRLRVAAATDRTAPDGAETPR